MTTEQSDARYRRYGRSGLSSRPFSMNKAHSCAFHRHGERYRRQIIGSNLCQCGFEEDRLILLGPDYLGRAGDAEFCEDASLQVTFQTWFDICLYSIQ
jgi:hypothetical protein